MIKSIRKQFDNSVIFQTKLHRQEYPHPSNCTQSWERTDFYDLAKLTFEHDRRELDYKLAVIFINVVLKFSKLVLNIAIKQWFMFIYHCII